MGKTSTELRINAEAQVRKKVQALVDSITHMYATDPSIVMAINELTKIEPEEAARSLLQHAERKESVGALSFLMQFARVGFRLTMFEWNEQQRRKH